MVTDEMARKVAMMDNGHDAFVKVNFCSKCKQHWIRCSCQLETLTEMDKRHKQEAREADWNYPGDTDESENIKGGY